MWPLHGPQLLNKNLLFLLKLLGQIFAITNMSAKWLKHQQKEQSKGK